MVNTVKYGMLLEQLTRLILGLFMLDDIKIQELSIKAHFAATELGDDLKPDPNDALAIDVMRLNNIKEICSFDEGFDKIEGILRLPVEVCVN